MHTHSVRKFLHIIWNHQLLHALQVIHNLYRLNTEIILAFALNEVYKPIEILKWDPSHSHTQCSIFQVYSDHCLSLKNTSLTIHRKKLIPLTQFAPTNGYNLGVDLQIPFKRTKKIKFSGNNHAPPDNSLKNTKQTPTARNQKLHASL